MVTSGPDAEQQMWRWSGVQQTEHSTVQRTSAQRLEALDDSKTARKLQTSLALAGEESGIRD